MQRQENPLLQSNLIKKLLSASKSITKFLNSVKYIDVSGYKYSVIMKTNKKLKLNSVKQNNLASRLFYTAIFRKNIVKIGNHEL